MHSIGIFGLGAIGLGLSMSYIFARLTTPAAEVRRQIRQIGRFGASN